MNGFVVNSAVAQFENSYSKYSENHNTYSARTGSVRAEALDAELKGKTRIDSYGGKDNVAILENAGDGLIFSVEVPLVGLLRSGKSCRWFGGCWRPQKDTRVRRTRRRVIG